MAAPKQPTVAITQATERLESVITTQVGVQPRSMQHGFSRVAKALENYLTKKGIVRLGDVLQRYLRRSALDDILQPVPTKHP